MDLSQVSRTAILLLICRALEAKKHPSDFNDPMAVLCLERLRSLATGEDKRWIDREVRVYGGIGAHDAASGVRRLRKFDAIVNRFIADHPGCTVINLACGFDTRYWRIDNQKCRYVEIDLPEVIEMKKEILKDQPLYEMIGCSVLDTTWMEIVTKKGNSNFLLIAEGLFMWIPEQEVKRVFKEISEKFDKSQLVLDMIPKSYTGRLMKFFMRLDAKITWGLDNVAWSYGIKRPEDLEAFGSGLKVIGLEKGSAGPIITISVNAAGSQNISHQLILRRRI
jgi:methyltransferase (TIGR00027 family)